MIKKKAVMFFFISILSVFLIGQDKNVKTVKIGIYDNMPKVYLDDKKKPAGFFPELLDYIFQKEKIRPEYVYGSWEQCLSRVESGQLDLMVDVAYSRERARKYEFNNEIFFNNWGVIYSRPEIRIENISELNGKKVAVMKSSIHYTGSEGIRELTGKLNINCDFMEVNSYNEVFQLVKDKKADCGVVNRSFGSTFYKQYDLVKTAIIFNPVELKVAFPLNSVKNKELIVIIDKNLKMMKNDQNSVYYKLINKYFADTADNLLPFVMLTDKEKEWIKDHPVIRLGIDPEFAPFEYFSENNEFCGISSDYINILNKTLGVNIEIVKGLSWAGVIKKIQNREIDLLSAVGITNERKNYLLFSNPYINYYRVIITKSDMPFITGLDDLKDLKVAVQKNSSHEGFLKDKTNIKPVLYDTLEECLFAVSNNKADAIIGNVAACSFWIRKLNITNLKISAPASQEIQNLHFAVRNDWPVLAVLINKVLSSISEQEKINIRQKWVNIEYSPGVEFKKLIKYIIFISAAALFIIILILLWNYNLKKEINKRKIVEEELKKAKYAAEAANSAKSIFFANMTHEIRTPMNAILGYAQILQKDDNLSDLQKKNITNIFQSGTHLLNLINNVLNMAKIESGKISLENTSFSINELLDDINNIFEVQARQKNLDFHINKSDKMPDIILGDKNKIKQILINLIGNSVKFTDSGEISCDVSFNKVTSKKRALNLKFIVKDTGTGIGKKDLTRIFRPFIQSSGVKHAEGSGLGLSISKNYAKMMNGDLTVKSEPGRGSTFTLTIEVLEGNPEESLISKNPKSIQKLNMNREIKVLIVDDKESNRDILIQILKPIGFTVKEAVSGIEAVKLFNDYKPDIILLDIVMPDMDGIKVIKSIRGLKEGKETVIISVTASAMESEIEEALRAGANTVVKKPFIEAELLEVMKRLGNLDYIYKAEKVKDEKKEYADLSRIKEILSKVPDELIMQIEDAVKIGYMTKIREAIEKIGEIDRSFAKILFEYAENYKYEEINKLIKK